MTLEVAETATSSLRNNHLAQTAGWRGVSPLLMMRLLYQNALLMKKRFNRRNQYQGIKWLFGGYFKTRAMSVAATLASTIEFIAVIDSQRSIASPQPNQS